MNNTVDEHSERADQSAPLLEDGWIELQGRRIRDSWALTGTRPVGDLMPMLFKYWTVLAGLFGSLTWAVGYFAIASFASGLGVTPNDLDQDSSSLALLGALGFVIAMIALTPFLGGLWLTSRLGPWVASLRVAVFSGCLVFLAALGLGLWLLTPLLLSTLGVGDVGSALARSLEIVFWGGVLIGLMTRGLALSQKWIARVVVAISLLMVLSLGFNTASRLVEDGSVGAVRSQAMAAGGDETEVFDGSLRYFIHPERGWMVLSETEKLCGVRVSNRVFLFVPEGQLEPQTLVGDALRFESAAC